MLAFLTTIVGITSLASQNAKDAGAAALKNPVASTPQSLATGKKAFDANGIQFASPMVQVTDVDEAAAAAAAVAARQVLQPPAS